MPLNRFDVRIILFLNHFANRWHWFDSLVTGVYGSSLLIYVPVTVLIWYALFDRGEERQLRKRHELLLGATLLSAIAVLVARALAESLPFRTRPIWTPALHFHLPLGETLSLLGWSSFPSDRAALFFTLATGILFVSRPLGVLAFGWVGAVICFSLLYLGIHWPTDLLAGAVLGISIAHVAKIPANRDTLTRLTTRWHRQHPGLFFTALFLWTYQIATVFHGLYLLLVGLWHLMKR